MTKKDLLFGDPNNSRYLPKIFSRRFPGSSRYASAAYKSDATDTDEDEDIDEMDRVELRDYIEDKDLDIKVTKEDTEDNLRVKIRAIEKKAAKEKPASGDKRTEKDLLEHIQKMMKRALKGVASKEEIRQITEAQEAGLAEVEIENLRAMADDKTGVMANLAKMGLEITRLKTQLRAVPEDISLRTQVKNWLESKNDEEGTISVRDVIKQIKGKKKADLKPLEIDLSGFHYRAANSPMLPSNTFGGGAYLPKPEFIPGVIDVVRQDYTFWNWLKKGASSSSQLVWVNKKVPAGSGQAAWIAPGVHKPGISFTLSTETSTAKKIADSAKVAVETLDDVDYMTDFIEEELMFQLFIKASTTLLSESAGDTETPAGIRYYGVPFVFDALGLATTNANLWDVINSGVAQIRKGSHRGAVTAIVSSIDYTNAMMKKAQTQGQMFVAPPVQATIVQDDELPTGKIIIGILTNYIIKIYKGMTIAWGLENDDFTKNLRTAICEMRLHQMFSENNVGSILYDDIKDGVDQLNAGVTA